MKWFSLLILCLFFSVATPANAYQTVAMDFPGNWYKIKYINNERDAIVQFVRQGYNQNNWDESVIFHTFKWTQERGMPAKNLLLSLLSDVQRKNNTLKVQYIRLDEEEALVSWCVNAVKDMPAHCEILRTTQSFEGALSMHYVNKDIRHFYTVKQDWVERISNARVYQSYFRLDRILNKSMTFEL